MPAQPGRPPGAVRLTVPARCSARRQERPADDSMVFVPGCSSTTRCTSAGGNRRSSISTAGLRLLVDHP